MGVELHGMDGDAVAPKESQDVLGEFLDALLTPDPARALSLVDAKVSGGTTFESVCLDVVQPALHEIGNLWQSAKVSVAQEHVATAICQSVLARSFDPADLSNGSERTMVASCPDAELHGLGLRMVADFAQRRGWKVHYLGTSVPVDHLRSFVELHEPDVVAISTSLSINLPSARNTFEMLSALQRKPFLVAGGNAYGGREASAISVGADAFAPDARAFTEVLDVRFS